MPGFRGRWPVPASLLGPVGDAAGGFSTRRARGRVPRWLPVCGVCAPRTGTGGGARPSLSGCFGAVSPEAGAPNLKR